MDTDEGRKFLLKYSTGDALSIEAKRELSGLLCGYILNQQKKLGANEISILANSIPSVYTKEIADVFFDGKKGILYSRAINMKKMERKGIV